MDKTEIIIGNLKIVKVDNLNWQIFELREIKKAKNPNHKSREGETDWVGLPAFFCSLMPALIKAGEINRKREIKSGNLDEAIAAIKAADSEFIKALNKAVKRLA